MFPHLISQEYSDAINYIPILLTAAAFTSMYGFLGYLYSAQKNTVGILKTTVVGSIVNIIVLFAALKHLNLFAPCIASMMSAFSIFILRYKDFKNLVNFRIENREIILGLLLFVVFLSFYSKVFYINVAVLILAAVVSLLINYQTLVFIFTLVIQRMKKSI